jgi:hypothetical protein
MGWDQQAMRSLMLKHANRCAPLEVISSTRASSRLRPVSSTEGRTAHRPGWIRLARRAGARCRKVLIDLPVSRQDLAEMSDHAFHRQLTSQWESRGDRSAAEDHHRSHGLVTIAEDLPSSWLWTISPILRIFPCHSNNFSFA